MNHFSLNNFTYSLKSFTCHVNVLQNDVKQIMFFCRDLTKKKCSHQKIIINDFLHNLSEPWQYKKIETKVTKPIKFSLVRKTSQHQLKNLKL